MNLSVNIGPARFRLAEVGHVLWPHLARRPFLRLDDGTQVWAVDVERALSLLIDHRTRCDEPSRVEVWRQSGSAEGLETILFVLCDAAPQRVLTG